MGMWGGEGVDPNRFHVITEAKEQTFDSIAQRTRNCLFGFQRVFHGVALGYQQPNGMTEKDEA